ncbi:UDP-N-acetylmuramate dehydrogenase [Portibacter lacus]|uniref:UDP-N-acetylenolpyruvoylglucosamine reductase n=1 Tax=Portibacter lacus TaxID=1099794 RepID=A0AA37SR51_9BACT|nr:UDP-N-acetylmuramate dehydrogenase [Portibacter lacus]GLR18367.1 UDP-N-acetylenolpyruvoylglucosamine reductase [Portibacter lacus]
MNRYEHISLSAYNTFMINAKCETLYKVHSVEELKSILSAEKAPFFILGGGSNLLISKDQDITFLKNEISGREITQEDDEMIHLTVGGGENWHELVLWAVENGYGGLENLSLIPGTVGASPIQNIGAYGVELDQVFHSLNAVRLSDGKQFTFHKDDCAFGYRDSVFKKKYKGQFFITHVTYRLTKKNHQINISYAPLAARFEKKPTIKQVSDAVIEIRQSKLPDPKVLGNSGSFFKNPIVKQVFHDQLKQEFPDMPAYVMKEGYMKIPAGWLIEQAGWKGKRVGDAGVYKNQALVLVNHGTASGPEIWALAQQIISDVAEKFGITLSPEVNII